jgi:hypothetical protein
MNGGKSEWLATAGSPLVALALLWLLRWWLPPGMALAIALTAGMAWGYYWKTGRADLVAVPVTIALALAVSRLFPPAWGGGIAVVFVVAGYLAVLRFRHRLPFAAKSPPDGGRPAS